MHERWVLCANVCCLKWESGTVAEVNSWLRVWGRESILQRVFAAIR
jgi:hypothetical protein